jgi:hypothetical protein
MSHLMLPAALMERAEAQAAKKGFASVADYLSELLEYDENPFAGREEQVVAAIREAIAGGPGVEMTDELWQEHHDRLAKRYASKAKP